MSRRVRGLPILTACACLAVWSPADLRSQGAVPAEAFLVGMVDGRAFRRAAGDPLEASVRQLLTHAEVHRVAQALNVDPVRDLERLVISIGGRDLTQPPRVAAVATFLRPIERFPEGLARSGFRAGRDGVQLDPATGLCVLPVQDRVVGFSRQPEALAFLREPGAATGPPLPPVLAALLPQVRAGSLAWLIGEFSRVPTAARDRWGAVITNDVLTDAARAVTSIAVSVAGADTLRLRAVASCGTFAQAKLISAAVTALAMIGAGAYREDPPVAALLQSLRADSEDTVVTVDGALPRAAAAAFLDRIRENRGTEAP